MMEITGTPGLPPAGVSAPTVGVSVPLAGVSAPPAGGSTPLAGVSTPFAGVSTPFAGVSTPPAGVSAPPAGVSVPPSGVPASPAGAFDFPAPSPTPSELDGRCLRQSTKERKHYTDEPLNDDDIEGRRTFSLEEPLNSEAYNTEYVKIHETGEGFNLKYIQEHGLFTPLLFKEKTGLGMRVPSKNFKVSDVKQCVGSRRHLDVMDVNTQKGLEMTMKDWVRYYENPSRDRLLNVISLEFSHTKLENYVESPTVVRQIDWVDAVWPRHLKECQTESTNLMHHMKYPKVQKYCLMSVKGCYTDFHIDFGGTSVWYHILHGEKIFWLIPPTEINIRLYEDWLMSGRQGDMFFGDQVQGCQRVRLIEGYTFMIPTGWIHAVFTPRDSLVFGGNFLHSYAIPMQLKCYEVEDRTRVPGKFRYPFMGEILWYVLDRYLSCLTGKSYRTLSAAELKKKAEDAEKEKALLSPKVKTENGDTTKKEIIEAKTEIPEIASLKAATSDPEISHSLEQLLAPKMDTTQETAHPQKPCPGSPRVYITSVKTTPMEVDVQPFSFPGESSQSSQSSLGSQRSGPGTPVNAGSNPPQMMTPPSTPLSHQAGPVLTPLVTPSRADTVPMSAPPTQPSTPAAPVVTPVQVQQDSNDAPLTVLHIPDEQESPQAPPTPALLSPAPVKPQGCKFLTKMEIEGLRALMKYVGEMPATKVPVPKDIQDPMALLQQLRELVQKHENDEQSLAISGEPTIFWPGTGKPLKPKGVKATGPKQPKTPKGKDKDKDPNSSVRRRRTRCKKCEACTRQDCGECHFCKDMRKFGGLGRMKQSCISRQCMAPVLPNTAICAICQKEERVKTNEEETTSLMECGICWEIVHPQCLIEKYENLDNTGNINEDLPNSWECPKCCHDGKRGQLKPRVPKGVSKIGKSEHAEHQEDDVTIVAVKQETAENTSTVAKEEKVVPFAPYQDLKPKTKQTLHPHPLNMSATAPVVKPPPAKGSEFFVDPEPLPKRRKPNEIDPPVAKVIAERFVVRPAPIPPPNTHVETNENPQHRLDRNLWMKVFRYLGPPDLYSCSQVCKTFDRWCIDRYLWRTIDLTDRRLTKEILIGVIRRQPSSLILAKTNVTSKQLQWFLGRLPLLRNLDLSYCSWSAVSALTLGSCPWLEKLRLDWVEGLGDDELNYLLSSASANRPGVKDSGSRLRKMTELSLVGTDITGSAVTYISHHLPSLVRIDLSHCPAVTTNSFDSPTKTPTFSQLNTVVLAGCRKLNSSILDFLNRLPGVKRVDLTGCSQITEAHIMLFNEANRSHPFRTLSGKILYRE